RAADVAGADETHPVRCRAGHAGILSSQPRRPRSGAPAWQDSEQRGRAAPAWRGGGHARGAGGGEWASASGRRTPSPRAAGSVARRGGAGGGPGRVATDGSPRVPSSVSRGDDGTWAVGRDADGQARLAPSRYEPNPKRRIDDGFVLLGSTALPVSTVIAEVLRRVAGEVGRQLGGRPDQVRLTHPARWGQRRRETLVAAAADTGLAPR